MAEQFQHGKHSNTSVLEFAEGSLLGNFSSHVKLSQFEVTKETIVVNGTDEEKHLRPSEGRDGIEGSNSVRDIAASKSRGDIKRESEELRNNISENGELGNTSVLHQKECTVRN